MHSEMFTEHVLNDFFVSAVHSLMKALLKLLILHTLNSRALVECSICLDIGHLSCYGITHHLRNALHRVTSVSAERRGAVPSQRNGAWHQQRQSIYSKYIAFRPACLATHKELQGTCYGSHVYEN